MKSRFTRRNTAIGAIALAVGMLIGTAGGGFAGEDTNQMPADKTAVAGAALEAFEPGEKGVILQQRMKVSSPADLILGVTLECSIITRLVTNTTTKEDDTTGAVDIWVTIDGKVVPVETTPTRDDGEVTFCNRTYYRSVADEEDDRDGEVDRQNDYIDTKTANAFNWVALNVGNEAYYDDPTNGNNILDIKVHATYTRTEDYATCVAVEQATSCSSAYVGKRTLVIEPVHAANGEESEPAGSSTSGGTTTTLAPAGIRLP